MYCSSLFEPCWNLYVSSHNRCLFEPSFKWWSLLLLYTYECRQVKSWISRCLKVVCECEWVFFLHFIVLYESPYVMHQVKIEKNSRKKNTRRDFYENVYVSSAYVVAWFGYTILFVLKSVLCNCRAVSKERRKETQMDFKICKFVVHWMWSHFTRKIWAAHEMYAWKSALHQRKRKRNVASPFKMLQSI